MQQPGDHAAEDAVLRLTDASQEHNLTDQQADAQVLVDRVPVRLRSEKQVLQGHRGQEVLQRCRQK